MTTTTSTTSTTGTAPGRVAIVTGASSGIGLQSAERLAADGLAVVAVYASNDRAANEVVEGITAAGGTAIAVKADVADEVQMGEVFATAERVYGGVDVVVNAAGVMILKPVVDFDLADLDRMHRTNIRGSFVVAQLAARTVRPGGAVIAFSTSVVRLALPTYAAYTASKGAVDAMTLVLAKELRGRDVTVNTVAPGPTATPLFLDGKDEATVERMAKMNPIERLGTPDDIAEVVSFLAGPGRWVNGQTLYVNGGMA